MEKQMRFVMEKRFALVVALLLGIFILAGSVEAANLIVYNNSAPSQTPYFVVNGTTAKVGVGIGVPSTALDVRGVGNFSGTVYINNNTDLSTVVAGTGINSWNVSGSNLFPADLSKNVGVGTTTPSEKLSVVGNIRTLSSSTTYSSEMYTDADAVSDPNGNEANANTGWDQAYGHSLPTIQNTGSAAGTYHFYVSGGNGAGMGKLLPVKAGKQYRVTFSVKVDSGDVRVGVWQASKIAWNGDPYGAFLASAVEDVGVTGWVTKTYDFTATENTLVFGTRTLSSSTHHIDNLSLKEIINTGDVLANNGYFANNIQAGGNGTNYLSGSSYFGGNVGIGTVSPAAKLHINDTTAVTTFTGVQNEGLTITGGTYVGNQYALVGFRPNDYSGNGNLAQVGAKFTSSGSFLQFGTSGNYGTGITNTAMTIDYNGYVGIGTTSPDQLLAINGAAGNNRLVSFRASDTTKGYVGLGTDNTMRLETTDSAGLALTTNSADRLTVSGVTGNVALAANISSSGGGLYAQNSGTPALVLNKIGTIQYSVFNDGTLKFTSGSGTGTYLFDNNVSTNGNFLTNLASPKVGTDAATKAYVDAAAGGGSGTALWSISGSNVYLNNTANSVGIGTATPSTKLQVIGGSNTSSSIKTDGYVEDVGGIVGSNMVPSHSWTVGSGSAGIFNQNGATSENAREWGTGPHGTSVILWKAVPDGDNNDDGGWNSNGFPIDNTKTYRSSVWVKKTNSNDGTTYFGLSGNALTYMNGAAEGGNPYFFCGDLPQLNRWYLLVGYVHSKDDSTMNFSGGIYDGVTGQKTNTFSTTDNNCYSDFKFTSGSTVQIHRTYLYYDSTPADRQYMWDPRFEEVNGKEPTIESLLGIGKPATQGTDAYFGGKVGVGTATPTLGHLQVNSGDTTSGLYVRGGDGGTGSSIANFVDTSSNSLMYLRGDGRVGIGTTSPTGKLDIQGASASNTYTAPSDQADLRVLSSNNRGYDGGIIEIGGSSGATGYIKTVAYNNNAGGMVFGTRQNSNDATMQPSMTLDPSGAVGIGTTGPRTKLEIADGTSPNITLYDNNAGNANAYFSIFGGDTATAYPEITTGSVWDRWLLGTSGSHTAGVYSNGGISIGQSYVLTAPPANGAIIQGNVGIGTASPGQRLTVDAAQGAAATTGTTQNGVLRLQVPSGVGYGEVLDIGMHVGVSGPPSYAWLQSTNAGALGTNYNLVLNPNGGSVGVGTASTNSFALNVNGRVNASSIAFLSTVGDVANNAPWYGAGLSNLNPQSLGGPAVQVAGYYGLNFQTATGQIYMRGDSSGQVGIGTTSPSTKLEVNGAFLADGPTSVISQASTDGALSYNINMINNVSSSAAGSGSGLAFGQNVAGLGNIVGLAGIMGSKDNGNSADYAGNLRFFTRVNGGSLTEQMRISSTGNVGIGATNPSYKLDLGSSTTGTIGNAQVMGASSNLFRDGSFDMWGTAYAGFNGPSCWGGDNAVITTVSPAPVGTQALQVAQTNAGGGCGTINPTTSIPVLANTTYTYSFWAKLISGAYGGANLMYIREYDSSGSQITEHGIFGGTLNGSWQHFSYSFTTLPNTYSVIAQQYNYATGTAQFDGFSFQKGSVSTDYTYSPYDIPSGAIAYGNLLVNGSLGVRTASPDAPLNVKGTGNDPYGTLHVANNAATNMNLALFEQTAAGGNSNQDIGMVVQIQGAAANDRIVNFKDYNSGSPISRFLVTRGGSVGIGATSPTQTLNVQGTFNATSTTGGAGITTDTTGNVVIVI